MDFLECGRRMLALYDCEPYLKLMIINVINSKYRKKGIATYYLEKLRDYAIKENISVVKVHPNPNDDIFKGQNKENRLERDKLKKFYENKSLPNLKFEIIWSRELYIRSSFKGFDGFGIWYWERKRSLHERDNMINSAKQRVDLNRDKIGIRNMLEKVIAKKNISDILKVDMSLIEEVLKEKK